MALHFILPIFLPSLAHTLAHIPFYYTHCLNLEALLPTKLSNFLFPTTHILFRNSFYSQLSLYLLHFHISVNKV